MIVANHRKDTTRLQKICTRMAGITAITCKFFHFCTRMASFMGKFFSANFIPANDLPTHIGLHEYFEVVSLVFLLDLDLPLDRRPRGQGRRRQLHDLRHPHLHRGERLQVRHRVRRVHLRSQWISRVTFFLQGDVMAMMSVVMWMMVTSKVDLEETLNSRERESDR